MRLLNYARETELALISHLNASSSGIHDPTGKGIDTEEVVERELIQPYLPPPFKTTKGAVSEAGIPAKQSGAIDRVIFNPADAPPLIYRKSHSIYPIEAVAGLVQITMNLDATKLREDIQLMAPVKAMRTRRFTEPVPGSTTKVFRQIGEGFLSPRSFVIGLPADPNWRPKTIAEALRRIQLDVGGQTHVHGLYVVGIGLFETIAIEKDEAPYRIRGWLGEDRLFRFADAFRGAFDTWKWRKRNWFADLSNYLPGEAEVLAE